MNGKKRTAETIIYDALQLLEKQVSKDPVTALEQAIKNATPLLMVKPRRVGGATYQVPVEVRPTRQNSLSIRWLVNTSRTRKEHSMAEKLGKELIDAFNNTGTVIKKKVDTIKMAEANKAFAHYRW